MFGIRNKILLASLSLLLSVTFTSLAVAKIGQSYLTNESGLVQGMAVSLSLESGNQNQFVEMLTLSNRERFVGVVATKESNIVTAVKAGDDVFVSTSGQAEVLASDLNGDIKKGDALGASPLKGIVMKAQTSEPKPIGYALEDFSSDVAYSETVEDGEGNKVETRIAAINLEIGAQKSTDDSQKPFLSLVGESITGKPVSQLQVIAALLLLFVILTVEGSIIYGAAHSTIQSVGRNPLARRSIYKHLIQILIVAGLILVFGVGGIYLILWT